MHVDLPSFANSTQLNDLELSRLWWKFIVARGTHCTSSYHPDMRMHMHMRLHTHMNTHTLIVIFSPHVHVPEITWGPPEGILGALLCLAEDRSINAACICNHTVGICWHSVFRVCFLLPHFELCPLCLQFLISVHKWYFRLVNLRARLSKQAYPRERQINKAAKRKRSKTVSKAQPKKKQRRAADDHGADGADGAALPAAKPKAKPRSRIPAKRISKLAHPVRASELEWAESNIAKNVSGRRVIKDKLNELRILECAKFSHNPSVCPKTGVVRAKVKVEPWLILAPNSVDITWDVS